MIKMSFKLNGRTIPANRIAAELTNKVKRSATEMATRRIRSIRCPIHHRTARLIPRGNGQFRVDGCCDRLIGEVQRQLR